MKKEYIKPVSMIIAVNNTEYLPIGGSMDYTDSGDDSGGGLAKPNIVFDSNSLVIKHNNLWE